MKPRPSFWAGKRVCVTGGTGFLGYHLVRQLLALGARVRVLALPPGPRHPLHAERSVEIVSGDVRESAIVRQAVADCAVVFHTAGVVAVWGPGLERMWSVHVTGTRNILHETPRQARVVHTSSVVAVGASPEPESLTEDCPFNLERLDVDYVRAKRAAELLALEAADERDVVVTNPGYLIGPEDHEHSVMGRFCVRFWKGRMPLAPPGGLNLVDVRDVARGHLLAAEHGRWGRRYILGGENGTFPELFDGLAEAADLRPRRTISVPWWMLWALAGAAECRAWFTGKEPYPSFQHVLLNRYHWFYSSDRAARELGYEPRPVMESLADTFRWYVARGGLEMRGWRRWWLRPDEERERAA